MIRSRFLGVLTGALLALFTGGVLHAEPLKVVATTPLMADLARQVGGDDVTVVTLMPPGTDPHRFEPTPQDLKAVSGAAVVLASGKGLEGYVQKLRAATGDRARLVEVGDHVPDLKADAAGTKTKEHAEEHDGDHDGDHDHKAEHDHDHDGDNDHGGEGHHHHLGKDPHWWNSIARMSEAAGYVATVFAQADPAHADAFAQRAKAYQERLAALQQWARLQWAAVPRDQRRIVSAHDSIGYLGEEWDITIIPVAGLSTAAAPSARRVAEIVDQIRANHVAALFAEDTFNPQVLAQIARDTGVRVGGDLWPEGPPQAGETYEDMARHNVTVLVEALKPAPPKP